MSAFGMELISSGTVGASVNDGLAQDSTIVGCLDGLPEPTHPFENSLRRSPLGRTALGLVHDLNNFLTVTNLYCDLLRERLGPEPCSSRYMEEIGFASAQAAGLAKQLMDLGRSQASSPATCLVAEIVEGMKDRLARLAGDAITVTYEIEPVVGRAAVDPAKLQRVLLNLVLNARDAMPTGGRIHIRAYRSPVKNSMSSGVNLSAAEGSLALPRVLLEVSDTGHGMDAAARAHLLDPFFTTKPAGTGGGLGMAAVHDVVSACGGQIYVRSAPGHGTTISLSFLTSSTVAGAHALARSPQTEKLCTAPD